MAPVRPMRPKADATAVKRTVDATMNPAAYVAARYRARPPEMRRIAPALGARTDAADSGARRERCASHAIAIARLMRPMMAGNSHSTMPPDAAVGAPRS